MKYEKSPLDSFLQQRISNNAEELKNTLNETLQMEQACLEQICLSINLCKKNIAVCEELIKSSSIVSLSIYETRKSAFTENLFKFYSKIILWQRYASWFRAYRPCIHSQWSVS